MIKLSFIKDSLLYTIGNALPMAASILLLPFYANYLNSTHYVALSFYIGISLLFQIIFSFSFEQYYGVIYTEIKHDVSEIKKLNGSVLLFLLSYGSMVLLLSALVGESILKNIFQKDIPVEYFPFGFLSILTGFLNALFKIMMSTYIYSQKPNIFFYSNLINFFSTIGISLGGLFLFPDSLIGPIYGRLLSGVIIVCFNLIILKQNILLTFEKKYIRNFVFKSSPLFAYSVIIWITGNIDRYFLKNYVDVNNLASYDLIMKCFIGIEFIQNGLSMAIISKVFDNWKKHNRVEFDLQTNRYFNVFIASIVILIAIFVWFLPIFIQLIIKDKIYYLSFIWINLIGIAYIIRTLTYPYYFAFLYTKKTIAFSLINAFSVLVQVLLSYIFIQQFGLIAAVFIHIFIRLLTVILYHIYISKQISTTHINYFKWFVIPATAVILYAFTYFDFLYQNMQLFNFLNIIALSLIIIIIYKNELKQLVFSKLFAHS